MKRWCVHLLIVGYLCLLVYGVLAHAMGYKKYANLAMYFIVWDMYGGWDGFETRFHLVGEGESGAFYDLTPPWMELHPYGADKRHNYDYSGRFSGRIASNTLQHTDHEPMVRVMLVEESWSKKFNIPEYLWNRQFEDPLDPYSYYYIRALYEPSGATTQLHYGWRGHLALHSLMSNPRVRGDMARSQPYLKNETLSGTRNSLIEPATFLRPAH